MVDKTMERYLGQIEYNIDYKLWLWGHYHALRIYPTANEGKSQPIMLFNGIALDVADFFNNYIDKVDFDIKQDIQSKDTASQEPVKNSNGGNKRNLWIFLAIIALVVILGIPVIIILLFAILYSLMQKKEHL